MKTIGDIIYRDNDVSSGRLAFVWGALLALCFATWQLAYLHLGEANLFLALAIALVKCVLVLWYFMSLRSSPKLVYLVFGMSLVMLFIGSVLLLSDYLSRG